MITKKDGKITVLINRGDFIEAVKIVAESNLELAKALHNQTVVNINNCAVTAGILIAHNDLSKEEETTSCDGDLEQQNIDQTT